MKNLFTLLFVLFCYADLSGTPRINSKKEFFDNINLDYSGLSLCKQYVAKGEYEKAFDAYVQFYEKRNDRVYYYSPKSFVKRIDFLMEETPDYIDRIRIEADSLKEGIFEVEGGKYKWANGEIPWRADNKEWINILNRLYCLRSLYVAYYATGKTEYLDSFCQYLWGWIGSNEVPDYEISLTGGTWQPYRQSYTAPHGPWRALEVGIRVSNMLDAYHAIYQQKRITPKMKWHFFRSLMEHALYIQNYLKRCANGNWESTVASGFASLCIMTPEWKCTEKLLDYSVKTINNNLKLAFNQDGFQFETTTGYHKHVVASYIRTEYLFHVLNGTTCLDETNRETLKKSIDIVALMKKPNGNDPVIGDCAFKYDGEKESIIKDDFLAL